MDVAVLTSLNEGTPRSLIEAGAAGRPSVATDVGAVSDVVRTGDTGLLVPPRDPAAVARGIIHLLKHPERARAMGDAARGLVTARFSGIRLADTMLEVYARALR